MSEDPENTYSRFMREDADNARLDRAERERAAKRLDELTQFEEAAAEPVEETTKSTGEVLKELADARPDLDGGVWDDPPTDISYEIGAPEQKITQVVTKVDSGGWLKPQQRHFPLFSYIEIKVKDPNDGDTEKIFWVMGYEEVGGTSSSSGNSSMASFFPSYFPSFFPSMTSSKLAIVPFRGEHIGWNCSEEPEAKFFDTVEVFFDGKEAYSCVDPEVINSVHPETLRVLSVNPDFPARTAGMIYFVPSIDRWVIRVDSKPFLLKKRPTKALVRIEGVAKHSEEKWRRFTPQQAHVNNLFWSAALR